MGQSIISDDHRRPNKQEFQPRFLGIFQPSFTQYFTDITFVSKTKPDNALTTILLAIDKNPSLNRLLKDLDRHQAVFRAAEGPLAELLRSLEFDGLSPYRQELERMEQLYQQFEEKFRLP